MGMKNGQLLPLARLFSFLGLLFLIIKCYLVVVISEFITNGNMLILRLVLFLGIGIFLGMLLCPLFISSPWQKKPLSASVVFILFLIVPNIALRSLGVERWISSEAISSIVTTLTNILYPLCCGLFFQTHLLITGEQPGNRTGRFCVFLFTLAPAAGMATRYGLFPALAFFGITPDPAGSMTLLHTINFWLIAGTGISALVCVTLLNAILPNKYKDVTSGQSHPGKTDWRMIFSLIGIAAVSRMLSSMMGIRFLPLVNYSFWTEKFFLMLMIGGLAILGFLAGRSILIFLRWYLPFAVALFILLPCIVLFDNSSNIVFLIDTILAIFSNATWVVFTVALIELFVPAENTSSAKAKQSNSLWFYILAGAIHFTNILISFSPVVSRHIPAGTGYSVWIIGIAAAALILLSFMVLVPKESNNKKIKDSNAIINQGVFKEYGLTKREIEVAVLLMEGLGKYGIGERLFISSGTAKIHISKVYEKFNVSNQREFMAMFVSMSNERG